jgi:hypothetical protein
MNSEQTHRNDQYLTAQIRLDALRAWRRPRPRMRIRVAKERRTARPTSVAPASAPLPEDALAA